MVHCTKKTDFLSPTAGNFSQDRQSDEALWSRYRKSQDRQLFNQLIRRYESELFRHLCRMLSNAQWAEDALQATLLKLHLKQDQFLPGRRFKPWLYAIATHQAIDLQRKNKRHQLQSLDQQYATETNAPTALVHRIESATAPPEQQLEQREIEQSVRQSVDDLPASLRQPLDLVYYQGLKIREVAEKLNIPQGTVKSRLRRALLTLSQTFNQPAPGETQSDSSRDIAPSTNRIDWQRQRLVAPPCCESETSRCG